MIPFGASEIWTAQKCRHRYGGNLKPPSWVALKSAFLCWIDVFWHLVIAAPLAHDVAAVHGDRLTGNVARG